MYTNIQAKSGKKRCKMGQKTKKTVKSGEKRLILTEKNHNIKIKLYLCKVYTTLMLWNKRI